MDEIYESALILHKKSMLSAESQHGRLFYEMLFFQFVFSYYLSISSIYADFYNKL